MGDKTDIGQCDIVIHKMDLKDDQPISFKPRRMSRGLDENRRIASTRHSQTKFTTMEIPNCCGECNNLHGL